LGHAGVDEGAESGAIATAAMPARALHGIDVLVPPSDDRRNDRLRVRPSGMDKKKREAEWAEAKRRCRLTAETLAMAKELGLNPRSLIKNIPSGSEPWKTPVAVWIRELHRKRLQEAARCRAAGQSRAAEEASAGGRLARDSQLKIVGLRFWNVMNPGQYAGFARFQEDARLRKWNLWGYVDGRDAAQAVRKALKAPITGPRCSSSPTPTRSSPARTPS